MAITLPKKIFGRTVEGGIERALAKAEADAGVVAKQDAAPEDANVPATQSQNPVQPQQPLPGQYMIDWSKFLPTGKIYAKSNEVEEGKKEFIRQLRLVQKMKKGYLQRQEIADLLTANNACDPKFTDFYINEWTSTVKESNIFPSAIPFCPMLESYIKAFKNSTTGTEMYRVITRWS
jgi:hypothetical protein